MYGLPVQFYYDTYYSNDSIITPFSLFTTNIPLKTKREHKTNYSISQTDLLFPYKIIPIGLKSPGNYTKVSNAEKVNLEQLIQKVVIPFFENHTPG